MNKVIYFINLHWIEVIGLLLAYFAILLPVQQYIGQRRQEERDKRFNNFHRLVKDLVETDPVTKDIKLDRQIAAAYEFRNYPEYYPITKRLLTDLKAQWDKVPRLVTELDLTLKYIEYKRTFIILRLFNKKP